MYVLAALTCFDASAADGDLKVGRVFHTLEVGKFPARLPQFVVVIRLCWTADEAGRYVLGVDLCDEGRRKLLELPRVAQMIELGPGGLAAQDGLFKIPPAVVEGPGLWYGVVTVDGREVARAPFAVVLREP